MGLVEYRLEIAAPFEDVFHLQTDAGRIPEWFPDALSVDGPRRIDKPGTRYEIVFDKASASEDVTRVEPPNLHERHFVDHRSKVEGIATVWLRPLDPDRTELTVSVEYFLPYGRLGRILDALPPIKRRARRGIEREFDSFRAFVERDQGTRAAK